LKANVRTIFLPVRAPTIITIVPSANHNSLSTRYDE
jgi:hypothetical protein